VWELIAVLVIFILLLSNWSCSGLFPEVIYRIETATSINGGKISDGGHEGPHGLSAGCSLLRVLETVMIFGLQFGFLSRCALRTVRLILQPNKDGAAQTYWSLAAHWTGRVAQNHILVSIIHCLFS